MDGLGTAARSDGAVDGDTGDLLYSLEFGLQRRAKARLLGVNTAETYGRPPGHPERLLGEQQTAFTRSWLAAAHQDRRDPWPLIVEFHGFDKYGRDLVVIRRRAGGPSLNQALIEAFPAVAVPSRQHQPPSR
mgnify:CR=1 FL=1